MGALPFLSWRGGLWTAFCDCCVEKERKNKGHRGMHDEHDALPDEMIARGVADAAFYIARLGRAAGIRV